MATGNVMGKLITPTLTAAPGIWNLRENQLAVQAGTWPGITAADATPFNNILTTKAVGAGLTTTTFRDGSTNNFAVTRNGDVTQGTFSPHFPAGYWSAYFDGSGDYLTIPSTSAVNLTGDYTIEAWLYPISWSSKYVPILRTNGGSQSLSFSKGYNANTFIINNVGSGDIITSSTLPATNTWSHVAAVRSGTTLSLFINGVRTATTTNSTSYSTGEVWIGGQAADSYNDPFNGYISNVRVVKGTAVYDPAQTSLTVPTTPLAAVTNTSLLTLQDNRFKDNSTNNLALTKAGDVAATRFSPFSPPRITAAAIGNGTGSVYFDGGGDYLTLPTSSAFTFGTGDFTIELWLNFSGNYSSGNYYVFDSGTNMNRIQIYNGTIYFYPSAGNYASASTSGILFTGRWHHLAMVRSGSTLTGYVDGVAVASASNSNNLTDNGLNIGSYAGGGAPINGYISNFRIVKAAVYTSNFTPPTTPLTAISGTSLLTCQDESTVTDASTNALTVTRNGDAKADAASPFKKATYTYGGSGYFDGSGDVLTVADNAALNMGTGDFTWELWFFPISGSAYQALMTKGTSYTGTSTGLWLAPGNNLHWSGTAWSGTSGAVRLAQWNHAAVTRNSGTVKVWLNGSLETSFTDSTDYTTTGAAFSIGDRTSGHAYGQYPFNGYISNARVVKGIAVYTGSSFTPTTTPITAITGTSLLLNFENAGIYDSIGRSDLRTLGTAKISTSTTKWDAASIALDGTANCCVKAVPGPDQPYSFGTADFTIEMWFYLTSMGTYPALFDWRPAGTSTASPCIMVSYGNTNKLTYYMGTSAQIVGTTSITTGKWYHAAVCRSSGVTRLFLNGAQEGGNYSDTNSYTGTNPTFGALGYDPSLTTYNLNGYLEDIRVTRAARYTTAFTPPTAPFA